MVLGRVWGLCVVGVVCGVWCVLCVVCVACRYVLVRRLDCVMCRREHPTVRTPVLNCERDPINGQ